MRVTFTASFRNATDDIARSAEQLTASQEQVSSGKRILKPSDDPAGTLAAISDRTTLGVLSLSTNSADAATSKLTVTDSTLTDMINKITAAQTTVASARGSTATQSTRDAAASDLQGISDALLSDFNAQFRGSYLFAGSQAQTAPFAVGPGGAVSAYQGDSTSVQLDVGQGRTAPISFDGGAIAQGSDAADIFSTLSSLVTAIKAGDQAGMSQGTAALDRALDRATQAQTQVGLNMSSLDDVRAQLTTANLDTSARLSKTEDADLATAITQMTEDETGYRAALNAVSRIGSFSLMDYLK